jgi:hypothetical protein
MSSHRSEVRPRYGRIAVLATSITVTVIAGLAGLGVVSSGSATAGVGAHGVPSTSPSVTPPTASTPDTSGTDPGSGTSASTGGSGNAAKLDKAVPASSGSGRRIVFSQDLQRVWLVGADDQVRRTYLVSGSVTDNLQPGTYAVFSRSRWAVGIDDSGVMQYFVRFTRGPTGAAIGFHSIPTRNGVPLQTKAQLGTPQSHGCIRQETPDAIALWNFAPDDTKVVVVA